MTEERRMRALLLAGVGGITAFAIVARYVQKRNLLRSKKTSGVLVVGSVNVDLYVDNEGKGLAFEGDGGKKVVASVDAVKGMTLPAEAFVKKILSEKKDKAAAEAFVLRMSGPFKQQTGGKGANTAAAAGLSSLGGSFFFGNFGASSSASNKKIMNELSRCNVDIGRSRFLENTSTGTAYIIKYADGDNGIVLIGGANQAWSSPVSTETMQHLRDAISKANVLMLQREIPSHVNVVAARMAQSFGVPVLLDVGGCEEAVDPALIPFVDVVMPNESELEWISGGCKVKTSDGRISMSLLRTAVSALKRSWSRSDVDVLITLGSYGAIYFEGGSCEGGNTKYQTTAHRRESLRRSTVDVLEDLGVESADIEIAKSSEPSMRETRQGIFPLIGSVDGKPIDTTGAGDCFRGSFAAARYGRGASVADALMYASAAASLCVMKMGAMPSMPTRNSVEAHVAAHESKCAMKGLAP
eukprot:g1897.t1